MPHRAMASVGVLAAALVVAAFAAISLAGPTPTVAAQASKPSSTWTLPRTPDGKPDLQGTWLNFDVRGLLVALQLPALSLRRRGTVV